MTQDTLSPLPCPFCGGSARTMKSARGLSWSNLYIAFCESEECGAEIRGSVGEEAAIAVWNRRAIKPAYAAMKEGAEPRSRRSHRADRES